MKKPGLLITFVFLAVVAFAQDAVVAPVRMNILYFGVSNPVEIAVTGISSDKITATVDNGTITQTANGWEIKPGALKNCIVSVYANKKKVADKTFRVKPIPAPVAVFANRYTGHVSKKDAAETGFLEAKLPEFDWDLKFIITSFTMLYQDGGYDYELTATSNNLTNEMQKRIAELTRGKSIIFKNIKAVGPDGKNIDLDPVILKLD